jgi:hypothetical protein
LIARLCEEAKKWRKVAAHKGKEKKEKEGRHIAGKIIPIKKLGEREDKSNLFKDRTDIGDVEMSRVMARARVYILGREDEVLN